MNVAELHKAIGDRGVTLRVEDGKLSASGGDFPPELRRKAGQMKEELTEYVQVRYADLAEAERQWLDHVTKDRGFFAYELLDSVSLILLDHYRELREAYLNGMTTLHEVYDAFSDYAKSTRINHFTWYLKGAIFEPQAYGKRVSQRDIHLAFTEGKLTRIRQQVTTPQIEPAMDQLDRMEKYFGIKKRNYALERKLGR
jgi:hypothetical protein